jgi:hypothetical protein
METNNSFLGYGLYMPPGSVQIVAVDDDDEQTWADVPLDNILIDKTTLKVRRSQYEALWELLRKHAA